MSEYHPLWKTQLQSGLEEMGIALGNDQQALLLDYLALLVKWNSAFNLTAIRDPGEMVARQLLDSLSILNLLRSERVLDVGTGPGLPGIPLAIALPGVHFTLLDSNGKKTRFVQRAVTTLKLPNVDVVHGRVESYRPKSPFDTVTSRAFAALPKMLELTAHLVAADGQLLAMKGTVPQDEINEVEQQSHKISVTPLEVPDTDGERHAILLKTE
ncbi:16S rRNA (guanine(527)-N(7))-methyltransferase RsmG [Solemya velesiana gill symbiont]|uniref:Ribosomal RNA small subunit methyltransferase G n=1 Tax=Solemya velesiana gill symbiont TaxID=1918948 RepID=A0A1T2KXH6_9GAMM|nr:16S rRNA (guanine(527)-N(7))-methyltransferase RsmG [Solemya velesiana gill symbiont]OOZ37567.1 16S rRNA (guanine(527)-N(7))-methyltransferase RsmG [Solemya velesiana gill symbiont]